MMNKKHASFLALSVQLSFCRFWNISITTKRCLFRTPKPTKVLATAYEALSMASLVHR